MAITMEQIKTLSSLMFLVSAIWFAAFPLGGLVFIKLKND